jgi:NifU-like protein involved in Fe-S cluster formation
MTEEDFEALVFDPPHLGMPGRPSSSGRRENGEGFVEIFVTVENGRIIDAGFLTDIPGDGLACASMYCEAAVGLKLSEADDLREEECLAKLPDAARERIFRTGLVGLCGQAMRQAVAEAGARAD